MIYAIGQDWGGLIKVGFSRDPLKRLSQLSTGSPHRLNLLGVFSGEKRHERLLHQALLPFHVKGEWFDDQHGFVSHAFTAFRDRRAPHEVPDPLGLDEVDELSARYWTKFLTFQVSQAVFYDCAVAAEQHLRVIMKADDD